MNKSTSTAYIDMLLNLLLVFLLLYALAVVQMRPVAEHHKGVERKAEFLVELTWPDQSPHDLDLWMLLPNGQTVGFNHKDAGIATLDRDDRGAFGDVFRTPDGKTQIIASNKEVIAVRAIYPGHYVVNVFFYNRFAGEQFGLPNSDGPVTATVKIIALNPDVRDLVSKNVELQDSGQQVTAFAFDVDADGTITNIDQEADVPFVAPKVGGN
jgi:hypothetical protein